MLRARRSRVKDGSDVGGSKDVAKNVGDIIESFLGRDNALKTLFSRSLRRAAEVDDGEALAVIPLLSPLANSVVFRCCTRILKLSTEKLQESFAAQFPDLAKQSTTYPTHLFEYCCFEALRLVTKQPDFLGDKDFRRLTYDMMLAWEAPGAGESAMMKEESCGRSEVEEYDGSSLFNTNSTCLALQVDDKKTVGVHAFARISPASPAIADSITVHNLFDALTTSSSGQLHFLVYDKYLKTLHKEVKSAKSMIGSTMATGLNLSDGEIILEIDGVSPTQPVLQHNGTFIRPGRLTLSSHALYFEPLRVGSYDKAVKYDLDTELKQVVRRELTGPLGARLFDKAVMYKSNALVEPVFFEFPEFKGHSRRDYWLSIILEVLLVHKFVRRFPVDRIQRAESLSKAILGIFRYRVLKEAFHISPCKSKGTLAFNLAENLPKGDMIMEALYNHLKQLAREAQGPTINGSTDKTLQVRLPFSLYTVSSLGFSLLNLEDRNKENESTILVGDVCVGAVSPLELAAKESFYHSEKVEAARASVDQVKMEGIDTNLAVMLELLSPVLKSAKQFHLLTTWEDPFRSTLFLIFNLYLFYRGWFRYVFSCIFLFLAVVMLWHKIRGKWKTAEGFHVKPPPSMNAVEQLLILQDAISRLETAVQAGNIILLKLRALLFAAIPKASDNVALTLIMLATTIALCPFKYFIVLLFVEAFTREMPLRKGSSDKSLRRLKEWWACVPAAPVELIRSQENKKTK